MSRLDRAPRASIARRASSARVDRSTSNRDRVRNSRRDLRRHRRDRRRVRPFGGALDRWRTDARVSTARDARAVARVAVSRARVGAVNTRRPFVCANSLIVYIVSRMLSIALQYGVGAATRTDTATSRVSRVTRSRARRAMTSGGGKRRRATARDARARWRVAHRAWMGVVAATAASAARGRRRWRRTRDDANARDETTSNLTMSDVCLYSPATI